MELRKVERKSSVEKMLWGRKDGIEVGFMDGADDDVGIEETDGDVDGTRFSSHEMSIINGS